MSVLKRIGYLLGLPALIIAVWYAMTVNSDSFFVTDPVTLAKTFVDTWIGERFWNDVAPSLVRLAVGLALAIGLGIGLGLLIGSFTLAARRSPSRCWSSCGPSRRRCWCRS